VSKHAPMSVRLATTDDVAAIFEIAATTPWDKNEYLRRQVDVGHVLVATEAERVVGFVAWNFEFFSLPFIWLVAVLPAYRRRGIASLLFDAVEAACAGWRLYSSTNLSHSVMQNFLEKRGYSPVGEVDLDPGDPEVFYRLDRTP
jgi:GNAT superfamily N-acetyltransferase